MNIKVYGCRGSIAISRPGSRYGGNTSCIKLASGDEYLVIDAGSGIMKLQEELRQKPPRTVNILISHLHLDHISGIGTFDPAWDKGRGVRIFTRSRDARPMDEQICGVFTPPYWPVSLKDIGAIEAVRLEADVPCKIGKFTVTGFEAVHPDKTISFHITDGVKTFVHLLDSELYGMDSQALYLIKKYCSGADVVVFDAAYSCEDYYNNRKGWGHSTIEQGVKLARELNNKLTIFAHFDQKYSDDELDGWKKYFDSDRFVMSYDGFEISI